MFLPCLESQFFFPTVFFYILFCVWDSCFIFLSESKQVRTERAIFRLNSFQAVSFYYSLWPSGSIQSRQSKQSPLARHEAMIGTMFPKLTDVLPITPVHIHTHLISLSLPELKLRHICLLASFVTWILAYTFRACRSVFIFLQHCMVWVVSC